MREHIRIAFFGSSLVSAFWNGAATYYRGILKALSALGYRITFYEPDAFERQQHRDIPDPEYAEVRVYPATGEAVRKMIDEAKSADIVVKASGVGVFDRLLEESLPALKTPDRRVVFWDVDAPATLERMSENKDDYFRPLAGEYDFVLTYGGGEPVVKAYNARGVKRCIPVYNALDPETHFPVLHEDRFAGSLGFLGNRMPDRENRVWEYFFRAAGLLPEKKFLLGGSGWNEYLPDHPNIGYLGHIYTGDHNAFNCSLDMVLNISRESMARFGFSPATRVFEAAGAGACLVTDSWKGIELFLTPGSECLVAHNGEEVAEYVKNVSPSEARGIGGAARERILDEHTYRHRALMLDPLFRETPVNGKTASAEKRRNS